MKAHTLHVLGIDLGTSSVKTVLVSVDGDAWAAPIVAEAQRSLTVQRPAPGWSEQDPEAWWTACLATLDELASRHPSEMADVGGIGLSGQMHGATLLDNREAVLRPAILWNDVRSAAECDELIANVPEIIAISGNIVAPGFTAPKLLWVARHEPACFARVARVLLPKDYLRLRLSGEAVGEMSDASGTCWLDTGARCWSDAVLAGTGLSTAQMPRLVEGSAVSTRLLPELAKRFGMRERVPIAGGAGDNAAAACGIGAVRPGDALLSLGTSGVLFAPTDSFRPNVAGGVHAFCHAIPDTWHQMGVILSAADSIEWLARLFGTEARTLTAALGDHVSRPSRAIFAPYLSGERTPHNDGGIRGAFAGLGHEADRAVMTQAVLEGVGFAVRDCLRVLGDAGTTVDAAWAVGGGAASRIWLRIIASILGIPLRLPAGAANGAAYGAARLAICAATGADPLMICTPPPIAETIDPDPALAAAYDDSYARFRALAPTLKEIAIR